MLGSLLVMQVRCFWDVLIRLVANFSVADPVSVLSLSACVTFASPCQIASCCLCAPSLTQEPEPGTHLEMFWSIASFFVSALSLSLLSALPVIFAQNQRHLD